jgi:hypothetical protein
MASPQQQGDDGPTPKPPQGSASTSTSTSTSVSPFHSIDGKGPLPSMQQQGDTGSDLPPMYPCRNSRSPTPYAPGGGGGESRAAAIFISNVGVDSAAATAAEATGLRAASAPMGGDGGRGVSPVRFFQGKGRRRRRRRRRRRGVGAGK